MHFYVTQKLFHFLYLEDLIAKIGLRSNNQHDEDNQIVMLMIPSMQTIRLQMHLLDNIGIQMWYKKRLLFQKMQHKMVYCHAVMKI